jgi:GNAT superfamily N-acetyltransferase
MAKNAKTQAITIRRARLSDAPRLAQLSGELGYPATLPEMLKRMRKLASSSQGALFVAESSEAGVIGWGQVTVNQLLEVGTRAELNGLVVSESQRSLGAGARLLEAIEAWARRHGCSAVSVRSNVLRERAHKFYERQGYEHYKTQKAFRKPL